MRRRSRISLCFRMVDTAMPDTGVPIHGDDSKMKSVADEVRAAGREATMFKADVTKRDEVYAAVDHAE